MFNTIFFQLKVHYLSIFVSLVVGDSFFGIEPLLAFFCALFFWLLFSSVLIASRMMWVVL